MSNEFSSISHAARLLHEADAILFISGAGFSNDSGLATFSGKGSRSSTSDNKAETEMPDGDASWLDRNSLTYKEISNPIYFKTNPQLAWNYWRDTISRYKLSAPHKGYDICQRISQMKVKGSFCYTTNIDGYWFRSGYNENHIYESHGNCHFIQCSRPSQRPACRLSVSPLDDVSAATNHNDNNSNSRSDLFSFGDIKSNISNSSNSSRVDVIMCKKCNEENCARPNVFMFNDKTFISHRIDAQERRYNEWTSFVQGSKVVIVELGCGVAVQTARRESFKISNFLNAPIIRITLESAGFEAESQQSLKMISSCVSIPLKCLDALVKIEAEINKLAMIRLDEGGFIVKNGTQCFVRPVQAGDEEVLSDFCLNKLGQESRRFFSPYDWSSSSSLMNQLTSSISKSLTGHDFHCIVQASSSSEVIAYAFLWSMRDDIPELGIAVADAWQGRGIGKQVLEILARVARSRGKAAIELTTMQDNEPAMHVYLSAGYEVLGIIRNPLGCDVTAAFRGEETPRDFSDENHMVLMLDETRRENVLSYLEGKRRKAEELFGK